jgi:hypothetical protein
MLQHRVDVVARAKLTRRSNELGAYFVGNAHSEVLLLEAGFAGAFAADELVVAESELFVLVDDASLELEALAPDSAGAEVSLESALLFAAVASRSAFFPSLP